MKIEELLEIKKDEKPLDNIVTDGGYASIFTTMTVIGDSLSSGEFEQKADDGSTWYLDMFEQAWGRYIERDCNNKVNIFSRGGMTAKEFMESFGESIDAFNESKKAQCYIIALGCNERNMKFEIGDVDDYEKKLDTFSRWYQELINKYKEMSPYAKFFFVGLPNTTFLSDYDREYSLKQRELLYKLAKKYKYSYVIDLYEYGKVYDKKIYEDLFLYGHMNPSGYRFTAKIIESYIDYIIRSNFKDFKQVGLINTPYYKEYSE